MDVQDPTMCELLAHMTHPLHEKMSNALQNCAQHVTEIRLYSDRAVCVYLGRQAYFLCDQGLRETQAHDAYRPGRKELAELVARLSDYALYAKECELREGYLTITGGHRIGVCTGYLSSGCVDYEAIGSLNIRVARAVVGCSQSISELLCLQSCRGLLLAGPPMCGKTTLLRDLIRKTSGAPYCKKISLVDERREIAACYRGVPSLNVGLCDVLDGFDKPNGIRMALRALSPEVIACDELLTASDVESLLQASLSGVTPLATVHAASLEDVTSSLILKPMLEHRCISHIVLLSNAPQPGTILKVVSLDPCSS